MAVRRRSWRSTACSMPDFPRNSKRTPAPSILACLSRMVVRPIEWFARAYSSLPTRMSVFSSSCTTAARTFSRVRRGCFKSAAVRARMRGRVCANVIETAVLDLVAHDAPFRVIAVLLAAAGIASRRLQMAARVRTNPDIRPRRRNRQRSNALQLGRVGDRPPVRPDIARHAFLRPTRRIPGTVMSLTYLRPAISADVDRRPSARRARPGGALARACGDRRGATRLCCSCSRRQVEGICGLIMDETQQVRCRTSRARPEVLR